MTSASETTEDWLLRMDALPGGDLGALVASAVEPEEIAVPASASVDRLTHHAEELLVELFGLVPEARAKAREELAVVMAALPPDTRRLLGVLQTDLEMLDGVDRAAGTPVPRDPQAALVSSMMGRRYGLAQLVLRAAPDAFGEVVRADARGRIWAMAGFPRAAALFFDRAADVSQEPFRVGIALDALARAGRVVEAADRAEALLAAPSCSPLLELPCARALFLAAKFRPHARQRAEHERVLAILDRVVARSSEHDEATWPGLVSAERVSAWMFRGHALGRLGRSDEALASFDQAVATDPRSLGARLSRGMLRAQLGMPSAAEDLSFAVESGVGFVPAYVVLAGILLRSGRLDECARVCERGLALHPARASEVSLREMSAASAGRESVAAVGEHVGTAIAAAAEDDSFLLAA